MKNSKLVLDRIECLANRISDNPRATVLVDRIMQQFIPYMICNVPANLADAMSDNPAASAIRMLNHAMPESLDDMAEADLRATVILLAERFFAHSELANILEGRKVERDLKC